MSMITALNNMIDSISQNVPKAENEYIGDDGLLHCAVCHKKTQTIVEFEGEKEGYAVSAIANRKSWKRTSRRKYKQKMKECAGDVSLKQIWLDGHLQTMTGRTLKYLTL